MKTFKKIRLNILTLSLLGICMAQAPFATSSKKEPMMGFKSFNSAQESLAGIELHHMLRKNQAKNSDTTSVFKQFYDLAA